VSGSSSLSASSSAAAEWRNYWYLPLAAAFGYSTSVLHVYSMGPFFGPLQQEFGWSRAQISSGVTIAAVLSGLLCIPMGMLVDRLGPRRIALVGVLAMCGGFALLSTATGQRANWYMLWGIIAIGTLGVQTPVWSSAVASRFETSRGLAFAITLSGASISATLFPLMATWLSGIYGWRTAMVAMAGIWAALVFPMILLCFRGAQDQGRKRRAAAAVMASSLPGLTLSEGLRTPALYKLLIASSFFSFTTLGVVLHFVPILRDSGATATAAAGIVSLVGIFSIIGRLGTGFLLDRLPAHRVGATAFLFPIVGSVLLLVAGTNPTSQACAAAAFGLTLGSEVDVVGYLAAKHFGLKNFGSLYGALVMALAVGTAFGPLAAGAVFDHNNSYAPFLMLTVVLAAVSAITLISLGQAPPEVAVE
jgi:MFS family permease